MPASITALLIGLAAGAGIGYLVSALRHKSSGSDSALLEDYKKQLEVERGKTESSIKLTAELSAMKSTVEKLSIQSNEANRVRTEAEAKLETTINEMRRASESLMKQRKLLAHFQIVRHVENLVRHN
jgi:DNA recombination protein RmuC